MWLWWGAFIVLPNCLGDEVMKLSFQPVPGMLRADLYYRPKLSPVAILVLCPGVNGDGINLIYRDEWINFAQNNNLGMVAISFASTIRDLNQHIGYYEAQRGSGSILLKALDKVFGENVPVLFYGFSGGAHFVVNFAEWQPDRVLAWSAYSAMWWNKPDNCNAHSPGIVICGEDDSRLGASLMFFKEGRRMNKPWLWIGIPGNSHWPHPLAEKFTRDFFKVILEDKSFSNSIWIDIEDGNCVDPQLIHHRLTSIAWLPHSRLLKLWKDLNGK